ncbi:MAG: hypothetical protein ACRBN8_22135 [Nannocystales bacterium]
MAKLHTIACLGLLALYGCDDKAPATEASDATKPTPAAAQKADAPSATVKASFDADNAFENPGGQLSLGKASLSLTLRAELKAPIKLSAAYPKDEKHASFEYKAKDGKVVIDGHEFETKLESSSMTPSREAFVIPIDAPDLDRSGSPNVPNIVFWSLEIPAQKAADLKASCGKQVEVKGTATLTSPHVAALSDLIVYDGDKEIPVEVSAKLDLDCG